MTARASPVEGKLFTPAVKGLLVLWALGTVAGLYRFTQGLGAATAMNDGYPWGIWIAVDVVVGTGLASGGYVLAFLVFILNRGRYHPLVRPALLTSLLGYGVAGVAVAFDLGRYWSIWRIPLHQCQALSSAQVANQIFFSTSSPASSGARFRHTVRLLSVRARALRPAPGHSG